MTKLILAIIVLPVSMISSILIMRYTTNINRPDSPELRKSIASIVFAIPLYLLFGYIISVNKC